MADVLIVDDDPGVRHFVSQALRLARFPSRAAASGGQALQLARAAWPAVVLLDLTLPGRLDGWATWAALSELAAGRPLTVLVLAGDLDGEARALAAARGAHAILRKPVTGGQLVAALAAAGVGVG